jgi:hypothetical protein
MRRSRIATRLAGLMLVVAMFASSSGRALTTTVYAAIDNKVMISSANPSVEQTVYGGSDLGIGCYWELYYYDDLPYQSFLCARSLLWFDVGALITGKTIQSAVLRVYPYLLPTDFDTSYSAAPILGEWHYDTVRWSNQPAAGSAVDTSSPPVTTSLPMDFDVTAAVQDWADGTRTNLGFRLRDVNDLVFPYDTIDRTVGLESLEYWFGSGRRPQLLLEIADQAAPTLTFWADPSHIQPAGSSTLHWTSTNATSCYSTTRGWGSPSMGTSGSVSVSPPTTKIYGLGCSGPGGDVEKLVTVTVPEASAAAAACAALAALGALRRLAT